MSLLAWLVFVLGFVLTAFGATAGAALVTATRAEVARAVSRRLRGATEALEELGDVEDRLAAAASLTALGVVVLAAAMPAVFSLGGVLGSALGLAAVTVPLVLVAGYFVPRWLTEPRAESVLARVAPVLAAVSRPLRALLPARPPGVAPGFRAVLREGAALGPDPARDLEMVSGVMRFAGRPVRELMTPRTDVVAVSVDDPPAEIARVFASSGYSRLPVYRGTLDEVVGMLHAFDLFKLRPGQPLPIRPVAQTPGSRRAADLLLDMQRERRHLALVLDEYGGTLGVVTMEDLLEELVGEIFDEDEPAGAVAAAAGPPVPLETDADTAVADVEAHFGVSLPEGTASTFGGLVAALAGRVPQPGERFALAGLEVAVVAATPARIERALVHAALPAQPLDGAAA